MKIIKQQLKKIIKEELNNVINEVGEVGFAGVPHSSNPKLLPRLINSYNRMARRVAQARKALIQKGLGSGQEKNELYNQARTELFNAAEWSGKAAATLQKILQQGDVPDEKQLDKQQRHQFLKGALASQAQHSASGGEAEYDLKESKTRITEQQLKELIKEELA